MDLRGKNGRPKRVRGGASDNAMTSRKGRSRGNQSVGDDIKGSPSTAAKRRNKVWCDVIICVFSSIYLHLSEYCDINKRRPCSEKTRVLIDLVVVR